MYPYRASHVSIDHVVRDPDEEREERREEKSVGCVPGWFVGEAKRLAAMAVPLILAMELNCTLFVNVVSIFLGRLGEMEMAGGSLAVTLMQLGQMGMMSGITTGCDTLFSQAYGAGKKKRVGIYLQQGFLSMILFSLLCGAMFMVAPSLLNMIGIDRRVTKLTGDYVLFLIPGLLGNGFFQVLSKYLLFQNKMSVVTWISLIGNMVNITGHILLVLQLQMGLVGSAISIVVSNWLMMLLTVVYLLVTGLYKPTWPGWTWESFRNWGLFARYALPGLSMLSAEFFGYELGSIMSGMIAPVYTSAIMVYSQVAAFFFQIISSLGVSCSVRVAYCLGANDITTARRATWVAYSVAAAVSVIPMLLKAIAAPFLPSIFTNQKDVQEVATFMLYISIPGDIFNSITTVQYGVLRGSGRQATGAAATLLGYFAVVEPIAVGLMFFTPLKGPGFTVAFVIGLAVICIALFFVLRRIDWEAQRKKAQNTVGNSTDGSDEEIGLLSGVKPPSIAKTAVQRPTENVTWLIFKRVTVFCLCLFTFLAAVFYKYQAGGFDCIFGCSDKDEIVRDGLLEPTTVYPHHLPNATRFNVYR